MSPVMTKVRITPPALPIIGASITSLHATGSADRQKRIGRLLSVFKALNIIAISILLMTLETVRAQQGEKTDTLNTVTIEDDIIEKVTYLPASYIDKQQIGNSYSYDVGEYLKTIPNVSGIRKGGTSIDPVIRGYKYSQLNIILNSGIKIENGCPNRMDPVTSHIEPEAIKSIEVIKGPFSLKYGPSFGGVVNLVAESPKPFEHFEIHANVQLGYESNWAGRKVHGSVFGGNKRIYFITEAGYKNYGNYQSGSTGEYNSTFETAFKKYDYSSKLGFTIKSNQYLTLSYASSQGRDVMFPALPMDEKMDDTRIMSLDYSIGNLSPVIKLLDIKFYRSVVDHIMDNSNRPGYAQMQMVADVHAINTGGRATLTTQLTNSRFLFGLDYENVQKDGLRTGTMEMMGTISINKKKLWHDANIQNVGLFAEYKTSFSTYEVNAGIRGDYNWARSGDTLKVFHDDIDYFNDVNAQYLNLSASVAITKKVNAWIDLTLALGRGTRSPNMLERYIKLLPVGYDNYDYLGNPQLKPETNNEIDLTIQTRNTGIGDVYLNFFYSYVQDYITANLLPPSVITAQSQGVFGVKQFENTGHIISKGFELGYQSPVKYKLGGGLTAALTYATIPSVTKYLTTDGEITDAVEISDDAVPEIPPLEANLNVHYRLLKGNLTPKVTLRYVADQRHTSEAFYEEDTPGFTLLNLSIVYTINKYAKLNCGINNVFDRAYYEHLNRRIIGSKENLYEPGRVIYTTLSIRI
jgi:iron complex outermembrane receptor protein